MPDTIKATVNFGASNLIVVGEVPYEQVIKEAEKEGVTAKPMGVKEDDEEAKSFVQTHKDSIITGLSALFFLAGWLIGLAGYGVAEISLLALSIVVGGYKTARSALYGIRRLNFDMNILMAIAVVGAAAIGEWIEGALVVIFFSLSNTLSVYTLEKARNSIKALMGLAPREATIVRNGEELRLAVEEIQVDDVMIVKPGEKLAMDGVIVRGSSSINQAAITGESMPVEKGINDEVFAGTINQQGSIQVKVTKRVEDTTLAKIIHLVQEAQGQRAKSQEYRIAMGVAGTDAALETADIALMADDLTKLPFTVRLSRATLRNIKQNIWFSNTVNIITMILIVPGYASLLFVALADVLAAVLVVLNAMRLMRINPPTPLTNSS